MAQEKELLKESINELENIVTKLESDNVALSNTLKLIASSNQQFRQHTIVGILTGKTITKGAISLISSNLHLKCVDDDKATKVRMEHQSNILEKTVILLRKEAYMEMNHIDVSLKVYNLFKAIN